MASVRIEASIWLMSPPWERSRPAVPRETELDSGPVDGKWKWRLRRACWRTYTRSRSMGSSIPARAADSSSE